MNKKLLKYSVGYFVTFELFDLIFKGSLFHELFLNLLFATLAAILLMKITTGTWTGVGR